MAKTDLEEQAYQFLSTNKLASLATVNRAGHPHVATIDFIVHRDLSLYFITRIEARKFKNLSTNSAVAMAITNEKELTTLQLSGTAKKIDDLDTEEVLVKELLTLRSHDASWLSKAPGLQLYERGLSTELAVIQVIPSEMTISTFSTKQVKNNQPLFQKII